MDYMDVLGFYIFFYLGVFWIMDHYTVLHFGTDFIAMPTQAKLQAAKLFCILIVTQRPHEILKASLSLYNTKMFFKIPNTINTS
jgi:hypothetical protein